MFPGCVPFRFSEDGNYLVAFLEPLDEVQDSPSARLERRNRADRGVQLTGWSVMQPLPRAGGCWSWPSAR